MQSGTQPIAGLMVITNQQVVEFRVTTLSELVAIWTIGEQERGVIGWP
jgi:hypothetical protein